jgi:DNA-binding phage protein
LCDDGQVFPIVRDVSDKGFMAKEYTASRYHSWFVVPTREIDIVRYLINGCRILNYLADARCELGAGIRLVSAIDSEIRTTGFSQTAIDAGISVQYRSLYQIKVSYVSKLWEAMCLAYRAKCISQLAADTGIERDLLWKLYAFGEIPNLKKVLRKVAPALGMSLPDFGPNEKDKILKALWEALWDSGLDKLAADTGIDRIEFQEVFVANRVIWDDSSTIFSVMVSLAAPVRKPKQGA